MREATRRKVEAYYSARVGHPLGAVRAGEVRVVAADSACKAARRSPLVLYILADRALLSTEQALVRPIQDLLSTVSRPEELAEEPVQERLVVLCAEHSGEVAHFVPYSGLRLYCDEESYARIADEHVRRVTVENVGVVIAALRAVGVPDDADYFLKDDAAFSYWVGDGPVGFAGTHPVGEFSDRVGNVMVGSLEGHRRRGCGKAVLSATTGELLRQGRVGVYGSHASDLASVRTARSVGYQPFATVFAVRVL